MKQTPTHIFLLAAMVGALLAPGAPGRAAVDDIGMLELYELKTLTVVYPSSPASRKDSNRISAQNRAAFLSAGSNAVIRIVSDTEASKSDLGDNLLLLGWSNRLVENHGLRPPYGKSSTTVRFIDYVEQDPDLDLMFICKSPFAPEDDPRSLFFWSRIDRERDRFMTMPRVGSDWAIYSDYTVIAQGMLDHAAGWPPKRDLIAEKLDDPDIKAYVRDRQSIESGPLRLIFNPNMVPRETAAEILKIRRRAHDQVVQALGDPGAGFKLDLYIYDDEETKLKLTGVKAGAHSVLGAGEMHMTVRFARSSSIHEDVHPVAGHLLGPTASTAAYEGLAYAVEPVLLDQPLTYYAAMMINEDSMPSIADLLDEERFRKLPNARRFAASGLLMTWLRDLAGLKKLTNWYTAPDPNPDRLAAVLGSDAGRLEMRFRKWIMGQTEAHSGDISFNTALGEAKAHHIKGEYDLAAAALVRALTYKPDDLQTRFNLATTRMKTGAYREATEELRKILDGGAGRTGALTVHALLQLGRAYDLLDRRDDALAAYRQVLELPNRYHSHISAREGLDTPFTADRLD